MTGLTFKIPTRASLEGPDVESTNMIKTRNRKLRLVFANIKCRVMKRNLRLP